jgi:hypothetical protein
MRNLLARSQHRQRDPARARAATPGGGGGGTRGSVEQRPCERRMRGLVHQQQHLGGSIARATRARARSRTPRRQELRLAHEPLELRRRTGGGLFG